MNKYTFTVPPGEGLNQRCLLPMPASNKASMSMRFSIYLSRFKFQHIRSLALREKAGVRESKKPKFEVR